LSVSELTYDRHDPRREVSAQNPWYTASQFDVHFSNPSYKAGVERRWRLFGDLISDWAADQDTSDSPHRVLDAGCGDGINLMGLGKLDTPCRLHGLDYNSLRLGRASSLSSVDGLTQGSAVELPYRDNSFDIILCSQVLEHISDAGSAVSEFRRILRPGGLMILAVPNEGCLLARLRNRVLQPSISRKTDHVNFYTAGSFSQGVSDTGCSVNRIEREGFFYPHLRLHVFIGSTQWGRKLSETLQHILPSQAAGIILACSPE